jgi:hypothetical protein
MFHIFCGIWLFASCPETGKNMPEKKEFLKIIIIIIS